MKLNEKYEVSQFGDTFDSIFSLLFRNNPLPSGVTTKEMKGNPSLDFVRYKEGDSETRIEVLLPGWKKADLDLAIEPTRLTLVSKKSKKAEEDSLFGKNQISLEIQLPEYLECKKATAKLDDGVLSILIPHYKKNQPQKLKIT